MFSEENKMGILLVLVTAVIAFFGAQSRRGREKKIYIAISVIAAAAGYAAGIFAEADHVGASLSGMVSIFMR